jgi:hypothetical protein
MTMEVAETARGVAGMTMEVAETAREGLPGERSPRCCGRRQERSMWKVAESARVVAGLLREVAGTAREGARVVWVLMEVAEITRGVAGVLTEVAETDRDVTGLLWDARPISFDAARAWCHLLPLSEGWWTAQRLEAHGDASLIVHFCKCC